MELWDAISTGASARTGTEYRKNKIKERKFNSCAHVQKHAEKYICRHEHANCYQWDGMILNFNRFPFKPHFGRNNENDDTGKLCVPRITKRFVSAEKRHRSNHLDS